MPNKIELLKHYFLYKFCWATLFCGYKKMRANVHPHPPTLVLPSSPLFSFAHLATLLGTKDDDDAGGRTDADAATANNTTRATSDDDKAEIDGRPR